MITKSHAATEEMMMDAVCEAVDDSGIENFTTKVWAKKANISEGSLYYHFKNREDLLEKSFLRIDRKFVDELKNIFTNCPGDLSAEKSVSHILNASLAFLCSHPVELHYYEAFSKTKLYIEKARAEQLKNWMELGEIFDVRKYDRNKILTEIQFFFTESVTSYADYLCSFDSGVSGDSTEYISKLLIIALTYILEEKAAG